MTETSMVAIWNVLAFVLFTFLLFAGFLRTFARLLYYVRNRAQRPRLLNRDAVMIGGFATSFGMILFVRAVGLGPVVRDSVVWAVATSIPALVAVAVYVYYEYAVIERTDR